MNSVIEDLPPIVRGNDWVRPVYLTAGDGKPWAVPHGDSIKCALSDDRGLQAYTNEVEVLHGAVGGDWDIGKIIIEFTDVETANIPDGLDIVRLEIRVEGNKKTSWFGLLPVETSVIS